MYVINHVPFKLVTIMPYELWTEQQLGLSFLKPCGCAAYSHDSSNKYEKLGLRERNVSL